MSTLFQVVSGEWVEWVFQLRLWCDGLPCRVARGERTVIWLQLAFPLYVSSFSHPPSNDECINFNGGPAERWMLRGGTRFGQTVHALVWNVHRPLLISLQFPCCRFCWDHLDQLFTFDWTLALMFAYWHIKRAIIIHSYEQMIHVYGSIINLHGKKRINCVISP